MKKLRYYAPYWLSAIVIIAIVFAAAAFFRGRGKINAYSELPGLAAELKDNEHFLRSDGTVWKFSEDIHDSLILTPVTDTEKHKIDSAEAKSLSEMLPHEYAELCSDYPIYIRKDGSVYCKRARRGNDEYLVYVHPFSTPSELPEDSVSSEAGWKITGDTNGGMSFTVPIPQTSVDVSCRLSVKLRDGWYHADDGECTLVQPNSAADGLYDYTFYLHFPALYAGEYRIEVFANGKCIYQNIKLTLNDAGTFTVSWMSGQDEQTTTVSEMWW